MRTVVVVQARLASTRLPAKVLLDLGGKTALERCLRRAARFLGVNEVVVATSDTPGDDVIAAVTRRLGFRVVRGSESDVLSRYALAARETEADVIVRCTSDCPLLDVGRSSAVLRAFAEAGGDYAANVLERRLPRGLDTEVFSRDALERAHLAARAPEEREHMTLHIYRNPQAFACLAVTEQDGPDRSHLRWTLDTLEDYRFLHAVHERLGNSVEEAGMEEVLKLLEREPSLAQINASVVQKEPGAA